METELVVYGIRLIAHKSADQPMPTSLKIGSLIALCVMPILLILLAVAAME